MKIILNTTGSLTAAGLALLAMTAPALAQSQAMPDNADPERGGALYATTCASCHGDKLQGQPDWQSAKADGTLPAPPHDDTGHSWHHGDDLLFNYTKLGGQAALAARGVTNFTSGMPAFDETLSDAEIWDILAYIKSTWPRRVRQIQQTRTDAEQLRGN